MDVIAYHGIERSAWCLQEWEGVNGSSVEAPCGTGVAWVFTLAGAGRLGSLIDCWELVWQDISQPFSASSSPPSLPLLAHVSFPLLSSYPYTIILFSLPLPSQSFSPFFCLSLSLLPSSSPAHQTWVSPLEWTSSLMVTSLIVS